MERRVLISPVGLEYERVLYGLTIFPSRVLYLIQSDEPTNPDPRSHQLYEATKNFANLIGSNAAKLMFEVKVVYKGIQLNAIETCIKSLKKIVIQELKTLPGTEIYINVSTATKNFALAAYLIAAYFQQRIPIKLFYLRANNYTILDLFTAKDILELKKAYLEKGTTSGPYDLEEIPVIPFLSIPTNMQHALHAFGGKKKFPKLTEFLLSIDPNFANFSLRDQKSTRMKYNYVLQQLENLGLVITHRTGRNIEISITKTGELLDLVISYEDERNHESPAEGSTDSNL